MLKSKFTMRLKDDLRLVKVLFTDLDGVLRFWDMEATARTEAVSGLPKNAFWKTAFAPDLVGAAVTGKMTDAEWREEGERRLREQYPDADVDTVVRAWEDAAGFVNNDVLEIVRTCRRRVPVGLITNATLGLAADLERLQLTDEFDYIFNTSELGVAKPDPAVFRKALETVGVEPEQSFFVDDHPDNVAAAIDLGMHGHVYKDAATLRKALQQVGLP